MKQVLAFFTFFLFFITGAFAELPYSKMLNLNPEQLSDKGFKFTEKKNQWVLTKTDGLNTTLNVLSALTVGNAATYKPSAKDYTVVLQMSQDGQVSSLTVTFYNDNTFNEIQTWLAENNISTINSASGKISLQRFTCDSLQVELRTAAVIQSSGSTTRSQYALNSNSIDNSYTVYSYTIWTGIPPYSEWLTKQEQKKAAKKAKGAKDDLNDLL